MTWDAIALFGRIGRFLRTRPARLIGRSLLFEMGLLVTGCAASPEVTTREPRTLAPATRPSPRRVAIAPPRPIKPQVAAPRARVMVKPIVLPPIKPVPEMWEGKGKCEGIASFYAGKFLGRRTANGEVYTGRALTAAHRVLPFGTYVKVTNLENGLDVIVRINDRGPFVDGRVIDLSPASAKKLHMTRQGLAKVKLEVVAAWMAE